MRRNEGCACVVFLSFGHEDVVTLEYEFLNFPDLTRKGPNDSDPDRFTLSSLVVSQSGGASTSASEMIAAYRKLFIRRFEDGLQ